jgi:hypothetical protein
VAFLHSDVTFPASWLENAGGGVDEAKEATYGEELGCPKPAGRGNGLQQVHSLSCGCILTKVDILFTKLWPLNRAAPPSLNAD